jgi:peptidoglycan/xylan/chitin deacetylase (PgdA/CDA1 family)
MKRVALTIDDGPSPDSTPDLLELLDRYNAKASWFLSGCRAQHHPDLIAAIVDRGHPVYAHGWDHIRLDRAGEEKLSGDMERCETLLSRFRPTPSPHLVRLPYNAGWRNRSVHRALSRWKPGCQIAHWPLSTEDHLIAPRCQRLEDIDLQCRAEVERIFNDPRLHGSLLLLHDQPINDNPGAAFKAQVTITLMRLILEALTANGWTTSLIQPRSKQSLWSRYAMTW